MVFQLLLSRKLHLAFTAGEVSDIRVDLYKMTIQLCLEHKLFTTRVATKLPLHMHFLKVLPQVQVSFEFSTTVFTCK